MQGAQGPLQLDSVRLVPAPLNSSIGQDSGSMPSTSDRMPSNCMANLVALLASMHTGPEPRRGLRLHTCPLPLAAASLGWTKVGGGMFDLTRPPLCALTFMSLGSLRRNEDPADTPTPYKGRPSSLTAMGKQSIRHQQRSAGASRAVCSTGQQRAGQDAGQAAVIPECAGTLTPNPLQTC